MPKVTDAYRSARRDEIIDAAVHCFAERGYSRTSMADVIAASGLSAGAIYGHFAGKQELFVATAARVLEARMLELDERRGGGEPLSPADVLITMVTGMGHEPFLAMIPQLWGEAVIDPEIRMIVGRVLARVRSTVADQLAAWGVEHPDRIDGDPETWGAHLAQVALGLATGYILQRALIDGFDEEAYFAGVRELLPH
ncbi:TetR/AcrR family transcriptional regulator [Agromyces intestinalis]|uniref:TetR/AcrR family transcriptional regulator n=1 Tax=Agromyces intestinalis TaxID=2592652 RepID=A0A5C1YH05_9MICO|nr:TetR/AcrR family transcriptional regulator [Agromyces intestinalis]QEO15261.1 TetR/AcrR family transcriptional regulator [Agromyces intestinalis]